jgi:hypothetical protein
VGPIRSDHAAYLAECLLLGERLPAEGRKGVAEAIADGAENIPYYIQHLVAAALRSWRDSRTPLRPEAIPHLVDEAIENPLDPWDLKHYRNRLTDYYGVDANKVGKLLDIYAHAATALTIDDTFMRLQSEGSPITECTELVALIERLELDHYLVRTGDADRFASPLVQRAWRMMRR